MNRSRVSSRRPSSLSSPTTFEIQLVAFGLLAPSIIVMNVYRPLSSSIPTFLDELADLITAVGVNVPGQLIMCGDLNCPGMDSTHIHDGLSSLLEFFDLTQHVKSPTNDHHILDIFVSEIPATVSNLTLWTPEDGIPTFRKRPNAAKLRYTVQTASYQARRPTVYHRYGS